LGDAVLLVAIFVLGYLAIVMEQTLRLNKSAAALLTGVLCWTAYIARGDQHVINEQLLHHLGELSQILFFLLTAMTIVEVIDAHNGFEVITSRVKTTNRRRLLFTISVLAFFLSAVLDNLTTSIVMMSLVRRLASDTEDRMYFGGVIIIAANAGGVWSPIGDVTTTMLWVGQQITTTRVITQLFVPALVSVIVPVLWIGLRLKGNVRRPGTRGGGQLETPATIAETAPLSGLSGVTSITLPADAEAVGQSLASLDLRAKTGASVLTLTRHGDVTAPSPSDPLREGDVLALAGSADDTARALGLLLAGDAPKPTTRLERRAVLIVGMGVLLFVPVFKTITHLPPVMGILLGLGVLWTLTELIHKRKNDGVRGTLTVSGALQRVDAQSVLFFLGILLAISALQSDGLLGGLAAWMDRRIGSVDVITLLIGLSSSIVDNVPLVAAAQGMYSLSTFPTDHRFWLFLAYCAGTGGSILIIGSAAGVAVMGIEHISFGWYVRRISTPALVGYAAGAGAYLALSSVLSP
jgi:Na+/H+ antiporter NhaD/arsenite permease-like protein